MLSSVKEYLVEEVSAEEEELLNKSGDTSEAADKPEVARSVERNDEILRVLDKLLLYLRIVHSTDFYSCAQYPEDEMPNRLGLLHVRESQGNTEAEQLSPAQAAQLSTEREEKLKCLGQTKKPLRDEEATKLGTELPLSSE